MGKIITSKSEYLFPIEQRPLVDTAFINKEIICLNDVSINSSFIISIEYKIRASDMTGDEAFTEATRRGLI